MEATELKDLKAKLCGKRIVTVEPSEWSGPVHSLTKNDEYFSIKLDDGTCLEVGDLFFRDGRESSQSENPQNPCMATAPNDGPLK